MDTRNHIREFIVTNFLFGDTTVNLTDETPLLDSGIIDSTGVLELIMFISEEFGLEVPPEDMLPQHFNSIGSLSHYLQQHSVVEEAL